MKQTNRLTWAAVAACFSMTAGSRADELATLDAVADKPNPAEMAEEPADPNDRPLGDGDPSKATIFEDPYNTGRPVLDSIWSLPLIYQNENNPIIQEFKIKGKYQWRNAEINSDQGDTELNENRRARLGATMKLLYNVEIEGEVNRIDEYGVTNDNFGYEGIDTLFATVNITQGLNASIGKMKPKFTYEYTTDSAELPVLERSLLVEQLMPAKSTGVAIHGESGNWGYEFGVYSGENSDGLTGFSDGLFYHARATYNFSDPDLEDVLDREFWHFDYINNTDDDINTSVVGYRQAVATGVYLENGPFSLAADVMYATGDVDVWGVTIMPAIFLVEDKLQLVGRYHFADTDDNDGLMLRPRYEQQAPALPNIRGDEYHSFYAGLNYYLYGNRIKLMTGLEFASMKDHSSIDIAAENYRGFTWLSGINMSF
jgi:phosphate-selective porin OprO/OprP